MLKLGRPLKLLFRNARNSASLTGNASISPSSLRRSPAVDSPPFLLDTCRSSRPSRRVLGFPTVSSQLVGRADLTVGIRCLFDRCGISSSKFFSLQRARFNGWSSLRNARGYFTITPEGAVYSLIGANVAVFALWRIADPIFMSKHFMISLDNFRSWRLHTLLTSAFSHIDADHLFSNMIGLYFFGTSITRLFGAEFLLKLYIAGALSGSIFFLVHKAFIAKGRQGRDYSRIPGLGASGAVNSVMLLNIFLFPTNIYYVNFVIPVPAMLLGAIWIGTDLWRVRQGDERVSGSAHLGGAFIAALVCGRIKGWI